MRFMKFPRRRRPIHSENAKTKSKKRALLVGISYNRGLKEPHKDVGMMKSLLIDKYNYHPNDIVVLVDDHNEKRKHLQPTKANLLREMKYLIDDAKRGDHFFFHYTGHVIQGEEDPNGPEEDSREEYIVPCDAGGSIAIQDCIQDDTLKELLVKRLPVGAHLTAIIDGRQSLLDLEHFRCSRVYAPRILGGRSDSMWNDVSAGAAPMDTNFGDTDVGVVSMPGGLDDDASLAAQVGPDTHSTEFFRGAHHFELRESTINAISGSQYISNTNGAGDWKGYAASAAGGGLATFATMLGYQEYPAQTQVVTCNTTTIIYQNTVTVSETLINMILGLQVIQVISKMFRRR